MAKAGLLFAGTDDGIVLFSDPGGVGRWLKIGQELRGRAIRAIWPVVDAPLVVLAAADGMGLQRSDDGGQSWRQALDAHVHSIAGHPRDAQALYLGTAHGEVYRSADGGASWELCPRDARPADGGGGQLAVAHDDPRRLYLGLGAGGVWASEDGGDRWTPFGAVSPIAVTAIVAAPARPTALYALAEGALYHCASASARWQRLEGARPASGAALAVLPGKEPVLLMALVDGGIGRSADGGATWTAIEPDTAWQQGATTIAPARYHMDTAFAGSEGGQLAQSSDRGRSWQTLKVGLAPVRSVAAARLA
jgi:hypothetical protein